MTVDYPVTPAVRVLRAEGVAFEPYLYEYEEMGGTRRSSAELGVPEHHVVKTLVMEALGDGPKAKPMIVLMHGDREVSVKALARFLNVKTVRPCDPKTAERHSGYQVGGTSPFGLKTPMPLYVERTVLGLDWILINGGKRGFLVKIIPQELVRVLSAAAVDAAAGGH